MSKSLVSIIIPVKNRSDLFQKAFQSALAQNYRPLEIIVVDDGSDEEEFYEIRNLVVDSEEFSQVTVQLFRNNLSGASAARNFGYKKSNGVYIQFLDSDDVLLPQKIETEINRLIRNPVLDFVYSKARFIDENEKLREEFWGSPLSGTSRDYFNFSYQTMCPLYRRSAIKKYGLWDENLLINQDWEFNIRYLLYGAKCQFINETHSYFRIHNKGNVGITDRKKDIIYSKFIAHRKIFNEINIKYKKDRVLKRLYLKRFIYIYLVTILVGKRDQVLEQEKYIVSNFSKFIFPFLVFFKNKKIAKTIIKIYDS